MIKKKGIFKLQPRTDPVTGELRFNAETVAAIEEGRAMMRGEIPGQRFSSFKEIWDDLMRDDPND